MQRFIIYTLIFSFILLIACSRRPNYVLSEEKMTDVLYDIQLAQAIFKTNNAFFSNTKKDAVIEGVLNKHGISQAELDSSLIWYADNISIYVDINDEVTERLRVQYDSVEARRYRLKNITRDWSNYIIPPHFRLTEYSPLMRFSIDSVKRKSLDLKNFNIAFDVQGMNKNQDVEAIIYYTYKDTLVRNTFSIDENSRYILKKPELADSLLKMVSGYIYMKNKIEEESSNVLFYNVSYSDSISLGTEEDITPLATEEPLSRNEEDSDLAKKESVKEQSDKTEERKSNTPKESDGVPILSKDDIEQSPILKRSRSKER